MIAGGNHTLHVRLTGGEKAEKLRKTNKIQVISLSFLSLSLIAEFWQ
jgi:hypothetical protein